MTSVILVDDNIDLLDAMHEILTNAGLTVSPFASGEAALELLNSNEAPSSKLIISDVVMSGMTRPMVSVRFVRRFRATELGT